MDAARGKIYFKHKKITKQFKTLNAHFKELFTERNSRRVGVNVYGKVLQQRL